MIVVVAAKVVYAAYTDMQTKMQTMTVQNDCLPAFVLHYHKYSLHYAYHMQHFVV